MSSVTRSTVSRRSSASGPATAWARSRSKVPANAPNRWKKDRPGSSSRSTDTSMAARTLRCRSGRPASRVRSTSRRSSSSARSSTGEMARAREAASSMASGSPSTRRHSSVTAATMSSVRSHVAPLAAARSRNNAAAGEASGSRSSMPGRTNGSRTRSVSSGTPMGSRLVATTWTPSLAVSRRLVSSAVDALTCSQLSSTTMACSSPTLTARASGDVKPSSALSTETSASASRSARCAT